MVKSRLESWLHWCVTLLVVAGLFAAWPAQALAAGGAGGGGAGGGGNSGGGNGGGGDHADAGTGGTAQPPERGKKKPPTPTTTLQTAFELTPTDAVRGAEVIVTGEDLPTEPDGVTLYLDELPIGEPTTVDPSGKRLTFIVPDKAGETNKQRSIAAGRYVVRLAEDKDSLRRTLGVLRIVGEKLPPFALDMVYPTIVYPNTNRMVVTGSGFGGELGDYRLLIDGVELALCESDQPICAGNSNTPTKDRCCNGLTARFVSDHQLEILGSVQDGKKDKQLVFRDSRGALLEGEHELSLRSGDETAGTKVKVAFSSWSASRVFWLAIAITTFLFVVIVAIALYGGGEHRVGSKKVTLGAFLLDTETDTFSLGKLQAFLWTGTAILAYCYLALSRTFVQGRLDIVDVPPNLLSILSISLGTTVASIAITKVRGPKASGPAHPSLDDLIKVGGVISPERVFFLMWTIVSIITFITNVVNVDPMVLADLPTVPDGLLALSGLSATGYLGGKIARGPGPVIDEVLLSGNVVTVMGRHLGIDATFEVDGKPVTQWLGNDRKPKLVTPDDRDGETYGKVLELTFKDLPPTWKKDVVEMGAIVGSLTIANSDGQRAGSEVTNAPQATSGTAASEGLGTPPTISPRPGPA